MCANVKIVVIYWRIEVYILRQQWQKLGNSPITRPRNNTPRDAQQRGMKLVTDGARMTIASGIRLYKHAYNVSGRGRHLMY